VIDEKVLVECNDIGAATTGCQNQKLGHPRNNGDWPKVGIFAQREKNRPNQIGTTICRIAKIEGRTLYVEGLDAVDGTPVLDIKLWVTEFGPRGSTFQPSWVTELMQSYWS
jgi:tRNA (Thr-GGU) A37 N-methylase